MYYRLTYTACSNRERIGDTILNGRKPLNIGQGSSCDVLLPESEQFEPQLYVTILPQENGDGWYMVRRTDGHHVLVNNTEVPIAKTLNSGDRLSFTDGVISTELLFEVFDDGEFDAGSGFVYKKHKSNKRLLVAATILALLAFGVALYGILSPRQKDLRHVDLSSFSQSIYHITADSVYLLCDSMVDGQHKLMVIESIELRDVAAGTAFLTSDSLFVTARHCVEPWINDEEWDGVSTKSKMSPEVRLATMAETKNRHVGYEKYILRSHLVISKGFERYDYYSTDFLMNKTRDMVLRLGTAKEVIYWRTIFPIAHRKDMELGDFAYVKATNLTREVPQAPVTMADWDDIVTFIKSSNHDIAVIGYPLNDNDADDVSVVYGNLMGLEFNDSLKTPTGCIQLSAPINRGNSGGPVFAQIGDELKVIGIVSKADGRANQGMFWAVPITEVQNMHRQGDKIEDDTVTFRR